MWEEGAWPVEVVAIFATLGGAGLASAKAAWGCELGCLGSEVAISGPVYDVIIEALDYIVWVDLVL